MLILHCKIIGNFGVLKDFGNTYKNIFGNYLYNPFDAVAILLIENMNSDCSLN